MGYMVVIEGTDGSGKQTQSKALYNKLVNLGYKVKLQSLPNYDSLSSAPVKMYLGGEFGDEKSLNAYQSSVLYTVDRLCTYQKNLKDFYESGGIVIMDRYVESNMLHHGGKIRDTEELEKYLKWLSDLEFETLKLPRADKVIFLDVPVDVSRRLMKERGIHKTNTARDIHEEDKDHLVRAYNSGKYCGRKYGWDIIPCTDGENMKSIEEISDMISDIVIKDIESKLDMEKHHELESL